jgi:crotonobetainyl-CoA:carnitine CoA-transferase CaiB-like acyl-CoA transferase
MSVADAGAAALAGVRVLDAGLLVQGPFAGQVLADLGAEVVKVEMPGVGDLARWAPASARDRRPPWFVACNRGKRSVCLDLRHERGAELFLALCERVDVVISNFVPGTMDGWGLGYDAVAARNPRIVYASGSAFGEHGRSAPFPGLDLCAQAASGLVSATGPAGPPGYPTGATVGDHIAALDLTIGILAALLARGHTGRGQRVTSSLLGGLLFAQSAELVAQALTGEPAPAGRGHGLLRTVYGVFRTQDGGVAISRVPETRRAAFWAAVGRPRMAGDPDLNGTLSPDARDRLARILDDALSVAPTAHWCEVFRELQVEHAPVRDYAAVLADPDSYGNGFLQRTSDPQWGEVSLPGNPIGLSATPARPGREVPELGADTVDVLSTYLGLTDDQVTDLHVQGVI